jgi:hypothetical protein
VSTESWTCLDIITILHVYRCLAHFSCLDHNFLFSLSRKMLVSVKTFSFKQSILVQRLITINTSVTSYVFNS